MGADVLNRGGNTLSGDAASYATSPVGGIVTVNGPASEGDAAGDVLTGIENLLGSALDDSLTGDSGGNRIDGGGGDGMTGGADSDIRISRPAITQRLRNHFYFGA